MSKIKYIQRLNRIYLLSVAEVIGTLIILIPIIIRYFSGESISGIFFEKAFSTLHFALFIREYNTIIFVFSLGLPVLFLIFISKWNERNNYKIITRFVSSIVLGYLVIEYLIYLLLDFLFYRSAFVSIPYLMGIVILSITIIHTSTDNDLIDNIRNLNNYKKLQLKTLYQLLKLIKLIILLVLSLSLIIPNTGIAGYLPTPPEQELTGFGGVEREYSVSRIRISYDLPDEFASYIQPINDSNEFYSYIYIPDTGDNVVKLPVIFLLHGIGSYQLDEYYNEIMMLMASRGSIAIFTQYPYDVILEGEFSVGDDDPFAYSPYAYMLYTSLWKGISDTVDYLNQTDVQIMLSGNKIDITNLMVIGHSYGGGMAPYIAYKSIEKGWGSNQLIISQEAPAYTNYWKGMRTNFSVFPDNTLVNLNVYSDDFRFPMCYTIREFDLYKESNIPQSQRIFSMIRSDKYGFPRLIATHYTPNDPTMDSLTYFGVFRRVDAMVGYLFGLSNNMQLLINESLPLFTSDVMLDMGEWSDGTSVNKMLWTNNAIDLADEFNNLDNNNCDDAFE